MTLAVNTFNETRVITLEVVVEVFFVIFFSVQECLFRVFLSFPLSNDIKFHLI